MATTATPGSSGFYPSPYNAEGAVLAAEHVHLPLHVVDVTFREGQQTPGVAFSATGEVQIVRALSDAGVRTVQAGYANGDEATVARIHEAAPEVDVAVLAVGWSPELTTAALASSVAAGASICSILMRSSPQHLRNLGLDADDATRHVAAATARAREAGFSEVIVAPSFTTLAHFSLLERFFEVGIAEGASVVSVTDSTGIAKPGAIRWMVSRLRDRFGSDVGIKVHTHNDYGLALANALAAVEAGADWIDVSVLGLGERAGNCALEELVVALRGLYGIDTGIVPERLTSLCQVVAEQAGLALPPMKPVVGANVFSNKLELHVKAIASDPTLLEPYDPAAVGNHRTLRLGRGTGPTAVRMKAKELGIDLPDDLVGPIVEHVNRSASEDRHEVDDGEFAELVQAMAREVPA